VWLPYASGTCESAMGCSGSVTSTSRMPPLGLGLSHLSFRLCDEIVTIRRAPTWIAPTSDPVHGTLATSTAASGFAMSTTCIPLPDATYA
jgi:hypothetical protein